MLRDELLQRTRFSPGYTKYRVRYLILQSFETNADIQSGQVFGIALRQADGLMPLSEFLWCDMDMLGVQAGNAADHLGLPCLL